jgi:putative transposase
MDARKALDAIIFRMRTGCQWNRLPKEFGDDSSVHRTLQRWEEAGLFEELWAILLLECEELGGVDWRWQAIDGQLGKAPGVPKKGQTRSALDPIPPTGPRQERKRACT